MKSLLTLIKLHKRNLDALRREMVNLENQKEQLQLLVKTLQSELAKELKLAAAAPEMAHFFGDFAKRIQKRQEEIASEIKSVDQKITKLNNEIMDAFAELKKYEIALENAKKRAAEEVRRKETLLLDEIAAQQHRRKEES